MLQGKPPTTAPGRLMRQSLLLWLLLLLSSTLGLLELSPPLLLLLLLLQPLLLLFLSGQVGWCLSLLGGLLGEGCTGVGCTGQPYCCSTMDASPADAAAMMAQMSAP